MSIMAYNGGCVVAMTGKDCVAIATDHRFGVQVSLHINTKYNSNFINRKLAHFRLKRSPPTSRKCSKWASICSSAWLAFRLTSSRSKNDSNSARVCTRSVRIEQCIRNDMQQCCQTSSTSIVLVHTSLSRSSLD